ncbi:MAG: hypothetical protein ACRCYX_08080 [Dermatophilaceae bacterium]
MSMTVMVRLAFLPWPRSVEVDPAGTVAQGRFLAAPGRVGWLALMVIGMQRTSREFTAGLASNRWLVALLL